MLSDHRLTDRVRQKRIVRYSKGTGSATESPGEKVYARGGVRQLEVKYGICASPGELQPREYREGEA